MYRHQVPVIDLNSGLLAQAAPQIFDEVMGELSALIAAGALGPAPTIHDLADGPTALAARETRTTIGPAALTIRRSPDAR